MTTVSTEDLQFQAAIQACAVALQRMAAYELDPPLHRRMRALGERKEFLSPAEHEELLALVDFAHQRTIEKLEARVALDRFVPHPLVACSTHERTLRSAPGYGGQPRWQPL